MGRWGAWGQGPGPARGVPEEGGGAPGDPLLSSAEFLSLSKGSLRLPGRTRLSAVVTRGGAQ